MPHWFRALLDAMDAWATDGTPPPDSRVPLRKDGTLATYQEWRERFPRIPGEMLTAGPAELPLLDHGPEVERGILSKEPPDVLNPNGYAVLVPLTDADGNDVAGIRAPMVQAPLGTYTGWNVTVPQLTDLRYLGGLIGGFDPFARTKAQRLANGDSRLSFAERYSGRSDYLDKVKRAANDLVRQRFLRAEDVPAVLQSAERMWNAVVGDPLP